jgi:hypothetical protein
MEPAGLAPIGSDYFSLVAVGARKDAAGMRAACETSLPPRGTRRGDLATLINHLHTGRDRTIQVVLGFKRRGVVVSAVSAQTCGAHCLVVIARVQKRP